METSFVNLRHSSFHPETKQICTLIDGFIHLLDAHNYKMRSYAEGSIRHFDSLDKGQRELILGEFKKYAEICAEVEITGISLRDSKELTRKILKKVGMVAPNDFFETLESDDIVEIYSAGGVQIFRNFVFFEHCSYTLLDLISYPWYELLERHESITQSIGAHIALVMGEGNDVIPSQVKAHSMRELFSEEKRLFTAKFNYFAPLFSGPGLKAGFICSGKLSCVPDVTRAIKFL